MEHEEGVEFKKRVEEKNFKISEFSLFAPKSSRALYVDYPELKRFPAFKELTTNDLLFTWYFSCEASPFFHISDNHIRAKKAAEKSLFVGSKLKCSQAEYGNILNLKFSPKLERAISIMEKFKVGPRIRAKMIYEKAFENIEKILDIDASDPSQFLNKDNEVDWAKKKSFVDTISSATKNIPEIIEKLEGNMGISSKYDAEENGDEDDGQSYIDQYHEQN